MTSIIRNIMAVLVGLMLSLALLSCGDDSRPTSGADGPIGPSGWFWQNPLPQGDNLTDVCFIDANTATAVGYAGTIMRTTDGGNTWVKQKSGTAQSLSDVSFTDASTGTAVGYSGTILRTNDGGGM